MALENNFEFDLRLCLHHRQCHVTNPNSTQSTELSTIAAQTHGAERLCVRVVQLKCSKATDT
jgi:hypothetical protein